MMHLSAEERLPFLNKHRLAAICCRSEYVVLDGNVKGNARIYGQKVTINGNIDGNVTIVGSSITIEKDTVIKGTLTYTAPKQATVETGAQIIGATTFTKHDFGNKNRGMMEMGGFIGMLMMLTLALVLVLVFKKFSGNVVEGATKDFWKDLGVGIFNRNLGIYCDGLIYDDHYRHAAFCFNWAN